MLNMKRFLFSDPFVKVTLMCQGHRITKRKTSVKRSTIFPIYNETMTFDVPYENIDDVSLIFKIMHQDRSEPTTQVHTTISKHNA